MSDDLLTTIRFEVDAAGMSAGLTSVKRSISELATKTKEISTTVNTELAKIDASTGLEKSVKKATKTLTQDLGELEKYIASAGTSAQTHLKNLDKSAAEVFVNLSGKGVDESRINAYLEKLLEAQNIAKKQAQDAAKAAAEQAAATGKQMAAEEIWSDLKKQHAADNKAIADQRAKELREELALIEAINDATLKMKTTGRAASTPPAYYEAKAGVKPSSDVSDALNAMKAEEAKIKAAAKAASEQSFEAVQQQMKILALNKQIQESQKATAEARAQEAAKTAKNIKDEAAALEAFKTEIQNAELNLVHFGRAKTAAFLQDKGARLGFDPAMVQSEIAALKKLEDARAAAFAAANPHITELAKRAEAAGTSVKGLTANLRNVPAQFTDIVISLQGGQNPLTVLLQQGGQLKDMFGGIGNAARALGGYVATLINPFSLAAAAVGTLGYAYYTGSKELDEYRKALILTGNTIGLTGGQMQDMARSMAAIGGTQSKAAEALAEFVNAGAAVAGSLQKFTASAIAFEKATGTAVSETAKQFAALGEKPLEASIKLNESTNFLTLSLYEQIKALEEQGKHTEAARVAQDAYADTINQRAGQITANLGTIERGWLAIVSASKQAWDAIKDIGREDSVSSKIIKAQQEMADILRNGDLIKYGGLSRADAIAAQITKIRQLQEDEKLGNLTAKAQADQSKRVNAEMAWDAIRQKHLSGQEKMELEIADAIEKGNAARKTQAEILKEINNIIDKGPKAEKPKSAKAESVERFGKELSQTKEWLATQERMLKDSYSTQQKDLEDSFKDQEITAAQYYARQLASDAESLQQREQIRAEAQARFDAEMAKRVAVTQARPESKAKSTALADLENEAKNFTAAQEAARQKDINSMAKHTNAMALEIDKESKKVTGSVDAYIADMQRKAQADAALVSAREAMAGQAPEIVAGMEAELKVRADAAKILEQTAQAYAKAAEDARTFEDSLASNFADGKEATNAEILILETLQSAARRARKSLVELGGAVDTTALDASITATAASIKKQTDEVAKEVQKTLVDGIMSAGKDGGAGLRKALEDVLVTKPFRIVIEAMLQPVSSAIAQGIMGQSIGGVAGATGFQTALNTASLAVSNFGSTALEAAKAVTLEGVSFAENASTIKALFSAGNYGQAAAGAIGTAFPAVAAAVAAKAIFDSMQGSVTPTGTFLYGGQGRFGGRQDFAQSGGLFGGGDTKNSSWFDPAPEVAKYMGAVEDVVLTSVKGWAQAIGLSAEAVDSYSKQVEVSIGGMDAKGVQEAIGKAFSGMADDIAQTKFGDFLLPLAKSGETLGATLQRLGTDLTTVNSTLADFGKPLFSATTQGVQDMEAFLSSLGGLEKFTQLANTLTTVNSVLAGFNKALFDTSVDGAQAAKALVDSVGGLDRFNALASNLESVNNVLMDLGQSTFDLSVEGAEAAAALSRSVGGTDKLTKLASELLQVNENLAKLGEPLLDISVASAQAAHGMLKATDMAVEAKEAAERLEASYASFVSNLSNADTSSVSSLQAAFNKALAAVTVSVPSIKGVGDLTSVTQEQYSSYTDPQRGKLDAAAAAYKSLQTAIDAAAKSAESAAKTAKDAADAAVKAYSDALKAIEKDTRNVNRELADFGKTDFQKKLAKIGYDSQDKLAELDELSAKAAELSATASDLSLKATEATIGKVSTISGELIKASGDLVDNSAEVAGNISTTLKNSTSALGDALTLAPAIASLFDEILKGLQKIPQALALVSNAVTGVGSAASTASGGLTAFGAAAGMVGSSASSATGPLTSAGAAFNAVSPAAAAAGAALNALGAAFDTASAALGGLTGTFGAASAAVDGLNAAFASAASGLGGLTSALSSASGAGASLAGSIGSVAGALADISGAAAGAAGSISSAASALSAAAGAASSVQTPAAPVVVAAAAGGAIHGPGTSTSDSVPAMLSDGEYVIKAASVDKYGLGFLNALNAGTLKRTIYRAGGGTVDADTLAQAMLLGVQTFDSAVTALGGFFEVLRDAENKITSATVKPVETYTVAAKTLGASGYDVTGLDAEGVKALILGVLDANKPTVNPETGLLGFSEDQIKVLLKLEKVLGSVYTVLKGLDEQKPWTDKLDVLTDKSTERELALKKDLASTKDTETQDIIRKVYAKEDLNKAREEEAKALESVRDALKNLQKEAYSFEADLNSAFGTSAGDSAAKTIRKDLALADVRQTVADAGLLQSSPTYAAMSEAEKLKTNAAIQSIRNTALLAEKQYDLNEARKEEIRLLGDAKSRLKSLTDSGASKQVDRLRLLGDDAGADKAQEAIDLADVYKSTADATALLATEGLTPLDKAAIQATIATNDATIAQYARNKALDDEIEVLNRYQSVKDDAESTNIELLRAMGQTANAAALELAKATKGFDDAQIATYRQTQATKSLIAAYGNLSSTADMVTSSRIGLLTAQGDTVGAAELQREFDIRPYVKAISDATIELGKATTETEKDTLRLTIATNEQSISNYDTAKALDVQAKSAEAAKQAADELTGRYKGLADDLHSAKIALMRASGQGDMADQLEFEDATEGFDALHKSMWREVQSTRQLTSARERLNQLTASVTANEIELMRARGQNDSADAAQLSTVTAPYYTQRDTAQRQLNSLITDQRDQYATYLTEQLPDTYTPGYLNNFNETELSNIVKNFDAGQGRFDLWASNNQIASADVVKILVDLIGTLNQSINAEVNNFGIQKDIRVTNEGNRLQDQLDELTKTPAELVSKALELTNDANKGLFVALQNAKTEKANQGWREKIDVLIDPKKQREIDMQRDLFAATDDTTKALIRQYYAHQELSDVIESTKSAIKGWAESTADIETKILRTRGKTAEANKAERDAALKPSIDAAAKAQAILDEQTNLPFAQKASLQSTVNLAKEAAVAYDLNKQKEAELKIIELQDEAMQQYLDSQQSVTQAQEAYADALKSTIETLQDFLKTLDGAATPTQNLSQARTDFRNVAQKAASGDTSAYKDLTPAAKAFLDLSKNYSKSIQDYRRDEAAVRTTLQAVINANQRELDKLPKEIAAAADPTKEAWLKLQDETAKQAEASKLLTAMMVDTEASKRRLRTAEETLADRYQEAITFMPAADMLQVMFEESIKGKVDQATLPEYTETFSLGDIWGTKIERVLPKEPLTNEELNKLIADKFPGLKPSDFSTPLTSEQLSGLINWKLPTITTTDVVGTPVTPTITDIIGSKYSVSVSDLIGNKVTIKTTDIVTGAATITTVDLLTGKITLEKSDIMTGDKVSLKVEDLIKGQIELNKQDVLGNQVSLKVEDLIKGQIELNKQDVLGNAVTLKATDFIGTGIAIQISDLVSSALQYGDLLSIFGGKIEMVDVGDLIESSLRKADLETLVSKKLPTLSVSDFVSSKADVSSIVGTRINTILPDTFFGVAFSAKEIMEAAIARAMIGIGSAIGTNTTTGTTTGTVTNTQSAADWAKSILMPTYTSSQGEIIGFGYATPIVLGYTLRNAIGKFDLKTIAAMAINEGVSSDKLFDMFPDKSKYGSLADFQQAMLNLGIPAFASGTNNVPHDMLAMIHKDEAIIPAPFNPERYSKASGNTALVEEIKALRAEVSRLREEQRAGNNAIAANTRKTAQALTKFDTDGMPETRT